MNDLSHKIIKIGTRGSPLALRQAEMVCAQLAQISCDIQTEIVVIKTSGDWKPADGEVLLNHEQGGKALFAKEIEEALLAGRIDAAVHSMKDMDSALPDGLMINHMLTREDPRDAVLLRPGLKKDLSTLSDKGIIIGCASIRRTAFVRTRYPDTQITPLRGNVKTRIDKLNAGQVDATFLAMAGLRRLRLTDHADIILEPEDFLPAAGQGAIGIEMRAGDTALSNVFDQISDHDTVHCVMAERAALTALNGSCHTPIGAYAVFETDADASKKGRKIWLRVNVVSPDGQNAFFEENRADIKTIQDAKALGHDIGIRLKATIPKNIHTLIF